MNSVILLHGALGSDVDLVKVEQGLKSHGTQVYSFSFSGHGRRSFKASFGIEDFVTELEDFIVQRHLKDISVFGYSMGGYVALYLASRQPNLIRRIITLGTKFNWSAETVEKETKMLEPERMLEKIPGFAKSLETKHGENWKELVHKTAAMMREIHKKQFLTKEVINSIKIPVCIGIADKDQMVSLEETLNVFKNLSNASMYMLPGSRHPLDSVNTELLIRVIIDFVSKP